ncbi:MAG: hypothetical protein GC192_10235 [Bacteroidetes bacterium]|nr:hypothetical protein [Bacteroidota bacterium]
MSLIRVISRMILLVGCLVFHIVWVVVPGIFKGRDVDRALRISQIWLGWFLRKLGLKIDKQGKPPTGSFIFVGNHRSYLDGIIAMSEVRSLPVVKAEVANWPLVGYGAKLTGIIFVKRESKMSRSATLDAMREALEMGYSVLVYPEGTTHLEPTTLEFRTGAFNMAAKKGYGIVPMAIDYENLTDAWVGDDTFIGHFIRSFKRKEMHVKIRYGQPIFADDVETLVSKTKQWIDDKMVNIRQEFDAEKTRKSDPSFAK